MIASLGDLSRQDSLPATNPPIDRRAIPVALSYLWLLLRLGADQKGRIGGAGGFIPFLEIDRQFKQRRRDAVFYHAVDGQIGVAGIDRIVEALIHHWVGDAHNYSVNY